MWEGMLVPCLDMYMSWKGKNSNRGGSKDGCNLQLAIYVCTTEISICFESFAPLSNMRLARFWSQSDPNWWSVLEDQVVHCIYWLAYRTRSTCGWPHSKQTQGCVKDGKVMERLLHEEQRMRKKGKWRKRERKTIDTKLLQLVIREGPLRSNWHVIFARSLATFISETAEN